METATATVTVRVRKDRLEELRRIVGAGDDDELVERALEEWLARQRTSGLTGWDAFDALIGMVHGPGDMAERHDEFGLGSDHR